MNNNLTYGSLFAGVGGFDLGFDSAGWECKFQVEWDKHCQEVLQRHWPDVPKYGDVRAVSGAMLTPVDLISFGSPCQDLSVAGKRSGLDGDRSGLFFEGIRIIKEMRDATGNQFPKWAIWENVAGALTSNKGDDFAEVLNQMANIGALAIEWHILDAQWFGVAQRRRRVFVIACWDSSAIERSGSQILSVPKDSTGNLKQSRKKRKQATRASEDSTDNTLWSGQVDPFVKAKRAKNQDDYESWTDNAISPTLNAFDNTGETRSTVLIVDGTRVNDVRIYDNEIMPTLKHRMGTGGGQVPLIGIQPDKAYSYDAYNNQINEDIYRTLRTGVDSGDHVIIPSQDTVYSLHIKQDPIHEEDLSICITEQMGVGVAIPIQGTVVGRSDTAGPNGKGFGDIGDPSYTLDTTGQNSVCTPELTLRRLTPLECERLMGFPDNHTALDSNGKKIADTNRYKMCGNAIASPVAEWIGKEIKKWIV